MNPTDTHPRPTRPARPAGRLAGLTLKLLAVCCAASVLSGCPVAAWIATVFTPPKKIPPQYDLPQDKVVLVLVDDPQYLVGYAPVKFELTRYINELLEAHRLVRKTIPQKDLLRLIASEPDFNRLPTTQVGKKLQADLVIVVEVDEFSLKDAPLSPVYHGKFKTSVRVVSTKKGKLWPTDRKRGFPATIVETERQEGDGSSQYEINLAKQMAQKMAGNIVNLFFEHTGPQHGDVPEKEIWAEP